MESSDLKSDSPDDAQLETWLRANASLAPLPDDDFSGRVLAALPPPARRRAPGRAIACAVGAVVGVVFALLQHQQGANPMGVDAALSVSFEQLTRPEVSVALGVTVAALLYVFWQNLRRLMPL